MTRSNDEREPHVPLPEPISGEPGTLAWLATLLDEHAPTDPQARDRAHLVARAVATGLGAEPNLSESVETEASFFRLQQRMELGKPLTSGSRNTRDISIRTHRRWASRGLMATAAAAILAVGFWGYRSTARPSTAPTAASATAYHTAAGQQSTIRLANGSVITLAPMTAMRVTDEGVTLQGEAYFDLAARNDRPFVVETQNAVVQVLGTKFVVRQYASERTSRVVVEDGKVALRRRVSTASPTVLSANMLAQVGDSGVTVTPGVAMSEYTAWMRGRLEFNEVPLGNVLAELERAYGADIRLADTLLARQPMTLAASSRVDTLAQVLDLISQIINAHVTRDGATYVITPGRAARSAPKSNHFPSSERQYGR